MSMRKFSCVTNVGFAPLAVAVALTVFALPNRISAQVCNPQHGIGASLGIIVTNCSGQVDQQGLGIVHLGDFVGLTITVRNNNDSFNGSLCRGDHYVITSMVISNITGGYAINSNLVGAPFTCPGGTQVGGRFPELLPANFNFADCGSCPTNALTNPQCTQYSPLYQSQGAPNNATVIIQITNTGTVNFGGGVAGYITNDPVSSVNGQPASAQPPGNILVINPKLCVSISCATNGASGDAQRYTFTASVTNCGDRVVNNIFITNQLDGGAGVRIAGPLTLNPGDAAITFSTNIAANCVAVTDTLTASGQDELFCPVVASNSATCQPNCQPAIKVYKQVVCYNNPCDAFNNDLTTQKSATAAKFDGLCPAFCYRITVTNLGLVTLSNVTLTDLSVPGPNILPSSSCVLPSPFNLAPAGQPNSGFTCTVPAVTRCDNDINVVTANGVGQVSGGGTTNVTATDTNTVTVTPINVQCTLYVSTNGPTGNFFTPTICATQQVALSTNYCVRIVVNNNGSLALHNVSVSDELGTFGNCFASPLNLGDLAVGASKTNDCCNIHCGAIGVPTNFKVAVTGEVSQASGEVCALTAQGQKIVATNECLTCVVCSGVPQICVTKEVACLLDANTCDTFSKFASAVQATNNGVTEIPAFCFRVSVTNCGSVPLDNVTVIDDHYGDLTADCFGNAPHSLAVGAGCEFVFKVEIADTNDNNVEFVTNIVTAAGVGAGTTVSNSASAAVEIVPAGVVCKKYFTIDGVLNPSDCSAGSCIPDTNPHTVIWYVAITNVGVATLVHGSITDVNGDLPCLFHQDLPCLTNGESTVIAVCTITNFVCTNSTPTHNTIDIEADEFTLGACTNALLCAKTLSGSNITATTSCEACLCCTPPPLVGCRVTGGGRQDLLSNPRQGQDGITEVCPPDSRYVTHGGQVGAPVGNAITNCPNELGCTNVLFQPLLVNNPIGNVCIHGRWTHVRHTQGGLEGNFHARFYDTLDCSCLQTQFDSCGRYVLGDTTTDPGRCNPGDRIAGPEPRKAPANKIVFTGVGDWADPNGRRTPRSVLFRVDIEDRSEPGGYHPGGAKPPADRYRIRIWVLTPTECQELAGAGPDPGLLHFRSAIAACYGINLRDGVESQFLANRCSAGSMFFGGCGDPAGCMVRNPDVDDGGELEHGNHQIHPQIKDCDPNNPQAPPLANSRLDCSNF